ncbi:MAG TPA: hypothetical protein VEF35_08495 [Candidatus Bathyarchaeia archaeon]|nr:hypothetical protein [Candidatus Bathyarchaeia archaeon]
MDKKIGFFIVYRQGTEATFYRQSLALERPDLAVNWAVTGSLEGT